MAWVGILDAQVLPVHWFSGSVDDPTYLEMLRTKVWPAIRNRASQKQYWFQQDGASPHCTLDVLSFLESKFGDRIISRRSQHHLATLQPGPQPS